ncbi:MAG: hypothetical protein ACI93R_003242 [Flavobacteriales bacterium]|jgi:hypothetical protein
MQPNSKDTTPFTIKIPETPIKIRLIFWATTTVTVGTAHNNRSYATRYAHPREAWKRVICRTHEASHPALSPTKNPAKCWVLLYGGEGGIPTLKQYNHM